MRESHFIRSLCVEHKVEEFFLTLSLFLLWPFSPFRPWLLFSLHFFHPVFIIPIHLLLKHCWTQIRPFLHQKTPFLFTSRYLFNGAEWPALVLSQLWSLPPPHSPVPPPPPSPPSPPPPPPPHPPPPTHRHHHQYRHRHFMTKSFDHHHHHISYGLLDAECLAP